MFTQMGTSGNLPFYFFFFIFFIWFLLLSLSLLYYYHYYIFTFSFVSFFSFFLCASVFFLKYLFLFLLSVGSYQVGYTRSHPNTEVKMLRACSVPLCSHRWERQVIYLFIFLYYSTLLYFTILYITLLYKFIPPILRPLWLYDYATSAYPFIASLYSSTLSLYLYKKTSLAGVEPAIFRFVVWRVSIAPQALLILLLTPSFSLLPDCSHG